MPARTTANRAVDHTYQREVKALCPGATVLAHVHRAERSHCAAILVRGPDMNAILARFYFLRPTAMLPVFLVGGRNTDQRPHFIRQIQARSFQQPLAISVGLARGPVVRTVTAVTRPEPHSGLRGHGCGTGDRGRNHTSLRCPDAHDQDGEGCLEPLFCQLLIHSDGQRSLPGPTHFPRSSALSGRSVANGRISGQNPCPHHRAPHPSMLVAVARQIRELCFRHARFAGSATGIFHASGRRRE